MAMCLFYLFESTDQNRCRSALLLFGISAHTATTSAAVLRSLLHACWPELTEGSGQGCMQDSQLLSGKLMETQLVENPLKLHTVANVRFRL